MRFTTQILPKRCGNIGVILLNNPKPLHALSLEMVHFLQDILPSWYADDSIQAILFRASNETKVPAFCAGGDVKQVYLNGIQAVEKDGVAVEHGQGVPGIPTAEFFRQEYTVNHMLATATKPQISIWDGIVMGGGVGLSIYGKYRIATENTTFAMPETGIGLFPDVGSMYWMPRILDKGMSRYVALTGVRLRAADLVKTGIATHFIPSDKLDAFETALIAASQTDNKDELANTIDRYNEQPPGDTKLDYEKIGQTFGPATSVEDVVERLEATGEDDAFRETTLDTLRKMSPTSLKLTMEGLKRGEACKTITEDLVMEFRMAQACMRPETSDFYEGIRSVLIDKDHNPQWNPRQLEDVTSEAIDRYFDPLEYEWEARQTSSSKL